MTEQYYISYTPDPGFATLRMKGHFVLLAARSGDVNDEFIKYARQIILDVIRMEEHLDESKECIQLRGIHHDDKSGSLRLYVDLIHDRDIPPSFTVDQIRESLHDGYAWYAYQSISVDVKIYPENTLSDGFFVNAPTYYNQYSQHIRSGCDRDMELDD